MGVWTTMGYTTIDADRLIFKPTAPLSDDVGLNPQLRRRPSTVHLSINLEGLNSGFSSLLFRQLQ